MLFILKNKIIRIWLNNNYNYEVFSINIAYLFLFLRKYFFNQFKLLIYNNFYYVFLFNLYCLNYLYLQIISYFFIHSYLHNK